MDIQRLRNLTTGRLHTHIRHVYEDLEYLTGHQGIMTHMIPNVMQAITPWLRAQVPDDRFWDGQHDTEHTGLLTIEPMTDDAFRDFFDRYRALPSLLTKDHIVMYCEVLRDK